MIKHGMNAEEWQWFKERTNLLLQEDSHGIVAYDKNGIAAMVVADTFTPVACNVHIACDRPSRIFRSLLDATADYCFKHRGCKRIFGQVPSNNRKAIKLDENIGFEYVTSVPDTLGDGIGTVILKLERENCRWGNLAQEQKAA